MADSFEAAFRAEYPRLNRYLKRRVGAAIADDLSVETFVTAYANWTYFDQGRPVRPWLYGIAANLLRHYWRSEGRMLEAYARTGVDAIYDDESAAEINRLSAADDFRAIAAELASLRPRDRDILLLHAWAEFTDREIAEALSVPMGTVKSRLNRLRERLRNRIDSDGQSVTKMLNAVTEAQR